MKRKILNYAMMLACLTPLLLTSCNGAAKKSATAKIETSADADLCAAALLRGDKDFDFTSAGCRTVARVYSLGSK